MSDKIPTGNELSYFARVASHDAARKGLAGAIAGVLIAAVVEAIWPNT